MVPVSTAALARACQIFLKLAYPGGAETIPQKRRIYCDLPPDRPASDFLPPAPVAAEVVQTLPAPGGGVRGWALRLGSIVFPHLKLKIQLVDYDNQSLWVFMVDTHDAFSKNSVQPPADHPDAAAWGALQSANRQLKEEIERAWEAAGLATFNSLLRSELPPATS